MNTPDTDRAKPALARHVFRGLGWSYFSAGLYAVLQLVIVSILAHLLPPAAFGALSVALIFVNIAERLGQLGIGPALVQREHLSQTQLDVGHTLSLILGVMLTAAFYLLAPTVAAFFNEPDLVPIIRFLSVIFIFDGWAVVAECTLQRELKFKQLAAIENLSYLFGAGLFGIGGALLGWGVWSLVTGHVAVRIIRLALLLRLVPITVSFSVEIKAAKEILSKGFGFSAGRLLSFTALYGDNFVVGKLLGTTALGLYSRAYQLMTLPSTYVGQMADRVLFPALANRQRDRDTMRIATCLLIEVLSLVSMPISMVMIFTAPEIITFLLGTQWSEAITILQVLAYGVFFRAGYKCGDTIARSVGEVYKHASIQGLYSLLVVTGSIIGARWGVTGVACGVLFAVCINYLAMSHLALRLVGLSWTTFLKAHMSGLWLALWCGAGCWICMPIIRELFELSLTRLAVMGVIVGIISLVAWRIMPGVCQGPLAPYLAKHVPARMLEGVRGKLVAFFLKLPSK